MHAFEQEHRCVRRNHDRELDPGIVEPKGGEEEQLRREKQEEQRRDADGSLPDPQLYDRVVRAGARRLDPDWKRRRRPLLRHRRESRRAGGMPIRSTRYPSPLGMRAIV